MKKVELGINKASGTANRPRYTLRVEVDSGEVHYTHTKMSRTAVQEVFLDVADIFRFLGYDVFADDKTGREFLPIGSPP
jgi:hypothetical protein